MKLIKKGKIMESGEVGVTCYARLVSNTPNVENSRYAYYERLLRFAKLIGITEAATLPETPITLDKDSIG